MRGRRLRRPRRTFSFAQEALGRFPGRPKLAAKQTGGPPTEIGVERRLGAADLRRELSDALEGGFRFFGGEALGPQNGLPVVGLQFQSLAGRGGRGGVARPRGPARLVREF